MTALTITQASCADDYDPNSMPVAKARAFIHQFLQPVRGTLRVPVRSALGRVLAEDILSPVDVPSHRNSAMDGWAMRGADLKSEGESTLAEIGVSFAGKPFGGSVATGQCVRIMTGGVVPAGASCAPPSWASSRPSASVRCRSSARCAWPSSRPATS